MQFGSFILSCRMVIVNFTYQRPSLFNSLAFTDLESPAAHRPRFLCMVQMIISDTMGYILHTVKKGEVFHKINMI
jgi:hypothetical protein